jgi:hypothetical protein
MARQALLRPIEIHAGNDSFTIGATTHTITAGVYANIYSVMKALSTAFTPISFIMSKPWRVSIVGTAGVPTITRTALSDLLGFGDANDTATNTLIAAYAPAYCWASTHQQNTADRWTTDSRGEFSGAMTMDGNLHGVSMSTRESLKIQWPWEPAESAFPQAAKIADLEYKRASYSFIPEKLSNFWTVTTESRTSFPVYSSSENIPTKGLYYIPDLDKSITGLGSIWFNDVYQLLTFDSGGTQFEVDDTSSVLNLFCFCSVSEAPRPPQSQRNLLTYYDVEVSLSTAVAPLWKV